MQKSSIIKKNSVCTGLNKIEWLLEIFVEICSALILLIIVIVLFAGVIFRYMLDSPLVWTGDLSSILFMWLSAFGAVIAIHRGEHMRLSMFVNSLRPSRKAWLEIIGLVLQIAICVAVFWPAYTYCKAQAFITIPSLGISDLYRIIAIPFSLILMPVFMLIHLLSIGNWKQISIALLAITLLDTGFYLLSGPWLASLGNINLILFFFAGVGICVLIGIPIAFSFAIGSLGYLALTSSIPHSIIVNRMASEMSDGVLLAVPLFIFLGALMEITGIAEALVRFFMSLVGHFRAGLSYVLIGSMYAVSGISGSKAADMAAVSPVLTPERIRRGEDAGEFVGLMSASGAMAETIPPSLILIIIGSTTGVSISALFTGGLLPATVGAVAMIIVASIRARYTSVETTERATFSQRASSFLLAIPALFLPLLIRASVVSGVATATEVATIGVVYCFVAGFFIYRKFDYRRFFPKIVEVVSLSGAIILIIGFASVMSWLLTRSGFSQDVIELVKNLPGQQFVFLAASILLFIILGSVLEGVPAIVLFGPLLFPVALQLGINEVHYSMVVILSMSLGLFAPPLGVGFYAACIIGHAEPDEAMQRIWPYLGALLVATIIVAAVPWISTGFLN